MQEKETKTTEKVTRERLRAMTAGDTLTVQCENGYDLDSQKNTAYAMKKLEGRRFSCRAEGLTLIVTCNGSD